MTEAFLLGHSVPSRVYSFLINRNVPNEILNRAYLHIIVFLPGFQKGREQFWQKKGNLHRTMKNLKNGQNFTTFKVNKMFSHKF
jgi:hypothetical protein